jgi:hypothetical protein
MAPRFTEKTTERKAAPTAENVTRINIAEARRAAIVQGIGRRKILVQHKEMPCGS